MTSRKTIRAVMSGITALAGVAGMLAAASPSSAAPAPTPGAQLFISEEGPNNPNVRVTIKGTYPMPEPDAFGFIKHISEKGCGGMHYILWGDDGNEQYIFDRNFPGAQSDRDGYLQSTPRGLEYLRSFLVPRAALNEDNDGVDEIFARVRFVDGDCRSRNQITNAIHGNY